MNPLKIFKPAGCSKEQLFDCNWYTGVFPDNTTIYLAVYPDDPEIDQAIVSIFKQKEIQINMAGTLKQCLITIRDYFLK